MQTNQESKTQNSKTICRIIRTQINWIPIDFWTMRKLVRMKSSKNSIKNLSWEKVRIPNLLKHAYIIVS